MLQDFLFFILFHNIGISNIEILQIFSIALCVADDLVTAKKFIRSLSRITILRMLSSISRHPSAKAMADASPSGCFHIVHHIRNNAEILFRRNHTASWLSLPDTSAVCFASPDSSKPFFLVSTGVFLCTSDIAST